MRSRPSSGRLTVEIVPDGAGCLLTLTQEGVDIAAELSLLPPGEAGSSEQGWRQGLELLTATLGEHPA